MGNVASCARPQRPASPSNSSVQSTLPEGSPDPELRFGMGFVPMTGTPRLSQYPSGGSSPWDAGAAVAMRERSFSARYTAPYTDRLDRDDVIDARVAARAAATRRRRSIDGTGNPAAEREKPPGLSGVGDCRVGDCRVGDYGVGYSVPRDHHAPDHKGMDYLAYSMEQDTRCADWLVVHDDTDAPPEEYRKTHHHLCQLMLELKGKTRKEGLARLKTYDDVGLTPVPTIPLPGMARLEQLVEAIHGYLTAHTSIAVQIGEKAVVMSLDGWGKGLGPDGITILDPEAKRCLAVDEQALAGVIADLCGRAPGDGAGAAPPSLDCQVSYLAEGSRENAECVDE